VISASALQSCGSRCEDSDHYLDLFHSSPELKFLAMFVNSQLACLQSVRILNNVMFDLNHLFELFAQPHSLCAINTAKGK